MGSLELISFWSISKGIIQNIVILKDNRQLFLHSKKHLCGNKILLQSYTSGIQSKTGSNLFLTVVLYYSAKENH